MYWAVDAFEVRSGALSTEYRDVDDVVAEFEADPEWATELAQARRESATELYGDAKTIAKLRLEKGISQKNLAAKLQTTQAQISKLENGLGNPQLTTIIALAQALEVELEELVRRLVLEMKR